MVTDDVEECQFEDLRALSLRRKRPTVACQVDGRTVEISEEPYHFSSRRRHETSRPFLSRNPLENGGRYRGEFAFSNRAPRAGQRSTCS